MVINKINTDFENQYNKYLSQSGSLFLISKKNIAYNSSIISKSNNAIICPVIKANAYGMGLLTIAKILIDLGYKKMFLANIAEGIEIRKNIKV